MQPKGPGSPFIDLFEAETSDIARDLPVEFTTIYSRWQLLDPTDRPYIFSNFVISRDGRISFNEPGKMSGGPISQNSKHDRWLMALLRARADAVLVGARMLESASRHRWTPEDIFPDDSAAWAALRAAEGRTPIPLHVVTTRSGKLHRSSRALTDPAVPKLIVSTTDGLERIKAEGDDIPNATLLSTGAQLDYRQLSTQLRTEFGVRTVLCEAGPQVYGAMIAAGVIDDEFVTLSPILVGNQADKHRPSLIEGVTFSPDDPPQSRLISVRRAGNLLFLHSRYRDEDTSEAQS